MSAAGQKLPTHRALGPPDVGCCSKIGRGFASLRNVAKGQEGDCAMDAKRRNEQQLFLPSPVFIGRMFWLH